MNFPSSPAAVAQAEIDFGYTQVKAPFDGVVTARLVSVGDLVGVSGPTQLATLVQLDPIYVTFNVSEQDVLRVRADLATAGLTAAELSKVPVEVGLMNEQGYPHAGTLDYAAPEVDSSTGTLQLRSVFANPKRALLPGYFVRVRIPQQRLAAEALLVPDPALGTDQAGRYLMVVNKDNVVSSAASRRASSTAPFG